MEVLRKYRHFIETRRISVHKKCMTILHPFASRCISMGCVASVYALGAGGRRFESCYPDKFGRYLYIKHLREISKYLSLRVRAPCGLKIRAFWVHNALFQCKNSA